MSTPTIEVKPELLRWAILRSGLPETELRKKFDKLDQWLAGDRSPTYRQLEHFAKKTMTPFGYMLLDSPPIEKLPVPDFRTIGDSPIDRMSPNLTDTLYSMQRRQSWMRDYVTEQRQDKLKFVGSASTATDFKSLAQRIRKELNLSADWAEHLSTWEETLKIFRAAIEKIGILVFSNSVVGANNHRPLDPEEFRGFVLSDEHVPLIFVNSADSKSARMFTLAHELAHVWLNQDGLFNLIRMMPSGDQTEKYCNRVAAEFLVPEYKLVERWPKAKRNRYPFRLIGKWFKVSPIVAARRALDLKLITRPEFFHFYQIDQANWQNLKTKQRKSPGGPHPDVVADSRLSRRFANALIASTNEGKTLYREAYTLIDMRGESFQRYSKHVAKRMKNERQ